jgi:hypothetical protein
VPFETPNPFPLMTESWMKEPSVVPPVRKPILFPVTVQRVTCSSVAGPQMPIWLPCCTAQCLKTSERQPPV